MKIAFPTMGDNGLKERISQHFGRAPTFTIVDIDTMDVKVIRNYGEHIGGNIKPAEYLLAQDVDILICSSLGYKAMNILRERGIEVYVGAEGTVEEAIELYRNGKLNSATEDTACGGM